MEGILRVLVTGPREWSDSSRVFRVLDELLQGQNQQIFVAHAGARGVDRIVHAWCQRTLAEDRGGSLSAMRQILDKGDASTRIRFEIYRPRWGSKEDGTWDRAAGYKANERMIVEHRPNLTLAFIDSQSRGPEQCRDVSIDTGIHTIVFHASGSVEEYNANGPTDRDDASLSGRRRRYGNGFNRVN